VHNGVTRMRVPGGPGRTLWALLGAVAVASLIAAWGLNAGRSAEPTPAQIVAMRFPAEWNKAPPVALIRRDEGNDLESRFFFSAQPIVDPAGNAAPAAVSGQATAYADPFAEVSGKGRPNRNAIFNDAQIANLRDRLKLTTAQKPYWPPVEQALRALTWHRTGSGKTASKTATIDGGSPEVQRLRAVAAPLLKSLREEQKREVQMMARLMGLESIASQF
jgi:hypothetical protein